MTRSSIRADLRRKSQPASSSPHVSGSRCTSRGSIPGRLQRHSQLCGFCHRLRRDGRVCRRLSPAISQSGTDDAQALRLIARRTWRFFETFVTAEDNMLPPDNFQEDPEAGRRSPHIPDEYWPLSAVGCRGARFRLAGNARCSWRGSKRRSRRWTELERFRGHFYNWYETRDLHPLEPKYISSVDSGNLAGHLIALANACREIVS